MKKIIALCLCLLVVVFCFTGCKYFRTSKEYELYDKFARKHEAGMTKQEVFDELGYPDAYGDTQGQRYNAEFEGNEKFNADIFSDIGVEWCYSCRKYTGSYDTYRLEITFDSEGKSVSACFVGIP